jgi:hypothetical protein
MTSRWLILLHKVLALFIVRQTRKVVNSHYGQSVVFNKLFKRPHFSMLKFSNGVIVEDVKLKDFVEVPFDEIMRVMMDSKKSCSHLIM